MSFSIDDFYGIATYEPADGYPNSWRQIGALKVETKICHRIWDDNDEFTVKEVGNMTLYKLNKYVDLLGVSDSISGEDGEVGVAIDSVLNPDLDEIDILDYDEEVLYAGNPFIVSWFEIKEEYRKKRLGHSLLHIALQSSGCEGHSIFFLPSENPDHAGFDFLTKFYLDADQRNYVVKDSRIVCCSNYNSSDSVFENRVEG
tara:strand:- start:328 stop:930 length:603 start_codon:yes stop_codon:yes gene_type:complete